MRYGTSDAGTCESSPAWVAWSRIGDIVTRESSSARQARSGTDGIGVHGSTLSCDVGTRGSLSARRARLGTAVALPQCDVGTCGDCTGDRVQLGVSRWTVALVARVAVQAGWNMYDVKSSSVIESRAWHLSKQQQSTAMLVSCKVGMSSNLSACVVGRQGSLSACNIGLCSSPSARMT